MVEVTKLNFEEMMVPIEKAIKNASFIAIDCEFTGLHVGTRDEIRLFDNPEERYQKLRCRATNFIPCQVGLSMFTRIINENSYLVETYVFFVRPYMCGSNDRRFLCQASALDFLTTYDFDFNKFFKEGIPYLNEVEESQANKEIEEGTLSYSHEKLMDLRPKREQDMIINNDMLKSSKSHENSSILPNSSETNSKAQLTFPKDKVYHEYFKISELRRKYPSLWAYSKDDSIIVETVSPNRRKELEKNTKDEKKKVIDHYLGFTKVFRLLKDAKKPIVGHNLLMDLLLFFHNFHRPLPRSYAEFKNDLHALFPIIFDTRHIWLNIKKVQKFKELPRQSSLFDLYDMFKNPKDDLSTLFSPDIHQSSDKYLTDKFPHESGYDSFVTGWVFLKICHLLAMKKITNPIYIQPQTFKQHLNAVSAFLNKLNIGRSRERYMNIGGDDPLPAVSEFLHISHRNSRTVLNLIELCRQFDKYPMVEFKLSGNRKSAIIAVGSIGSFKDILRDFKSDPCYVVTKYSVFKHSPAVNAAIWMTALGCGCMVAFFISRFSFLQINVK